MILNSQHASSAVHLSVTGVMLSVAKRSLALSILLRSAMDRRALEVDAQIVAQRSRWGSTNAWYSITLSFVVSPLFTLLMDAMPKATDWRTWRKWASQFRCESITTPKYFVVSTRFSSSPFVKTLEGWWLANTWEISYKGFHSWQDFREWNESNIRLIWLD